MKYKQQDFVKNIQNALKYEDMKAVDDILVTEIGFLLNEYKPELVEAIQNAGVDIPSDIDDENLMKVISYAIQSGKTNVIQGIVTLILSSEHSNFIGKIADAAGKFGEMGGNIANAVSQRKQAEAAAKAAAEQTKQAKYGLVANLAQAKVYAAEARAKAREAARRAKESGALYWGIAGTVVVMAIAGGIIYYVKNKS